jgi:hypothetical protein
VKRLWVLGLLALSTVLSCASDDEAEAFGEHDIEGTVSDEFTKKAVSGAKVTFVSDTLDEAETTSDGNGRFELRVEVPEGVRFGTIGASRAGYADSPRISVYFDGSAIRTELKMRPTN